MTRVLVLDDDMSVLDSLLAILTSAGVASVGWTTPAELFTDLKGPAESCCVLLDVRLKLENGLDVLQRIRRDHPHVVVIMISGQSDISTAISAMRLGAYDFLEKPLLPQELLDRVHRALKSSECLLKRQLRAADFEQRHGQMTPREQEVMQLLVTGMTCKEIAYSIGLSFKTVHTHRSHILTKMGVHSVVRLSNLNHEEHGAEGAGWTNRHQAQVIEYLIEENRVLKEQLGNRTSDQQPLNLIGRLRESRQQL